VYCSIFVKTVQTPPACIDAFSFLDEIPNRLGNYIFTSGSINGVVQQWALLSRLCPKKAPIVEIHFSECKLWRGEFPRLDILIYNQ
jgi:hypothetical protein